LGFFVGLAALGVDFAKVTILAGAFTVGIGFWLQTVINNSVCGLILLFERPNKVGDLIQIDTDVGEVRRIGIRACIIRTADGAEVIVPNRAIISNKVTNWTISDRYRAVEVRKVKTKRGLPTALMPAPLARLMTEGILVPKMRFATALLSRAASSGIRFIKWTPSFSSERPLSTFRKGTTRFTFQR
jgi:hypothetical protein